MLYLHAYDDNLVSESCQELSTAVPGDQLAGPEDGGLCSAPTLNDAVRAWLSFFTRLNSSQTQEKLRRKQARFLLRAFRGVAVGLAKGYRFRWFVLTESDEAISAGKRFGSEFNRFITWLRYHCPDFQYIVVEHGFPRRHWHILSYGSDWLPVRLMRDYWRGHYLSTVTGMAEVLNIEKAIYYVAGYLKRGDKFVRCWSSSGWVFRGWLGFGREYRAVYGEYPSASVVNGLALMVKAVRDYEKMWLLETGYDSRLYLESEVGSDGEVAEIRGSQ